MGRRRNDGYGSEDELDVKDSSAWIIDVLELVSVNQLKTRTYLVQNHVVNTGAFDTFQPVYMTLALLT